MHTAVLHVSKSVTAAEQSIVYEMQASGTVTL